MNEQFVDLKYPERGLDLSTEFGQQRPGTTPLATNTRFYEPSTDRARGGSRPGIVRFIDEALPLP